MDSHTGLAETSSSLAAGYIACPNSWFVPRFLAWMKASDRKVLSKVVIGRWKEESVNARSEGRKRKE